MKYEVDESGKRITIYHKNYWIKKGYTEEESLIKIEQYKKETSCRCKEFWIKRGYTEEESIKKVSEYQFNSSLKQEKSKIQNVYLEKTWIDKGYSETEAIEKVKSLKEKCNFYTSKSEEELTEIYQKRRETFLLKSEKERENINKSKGVFKSDLIERYGLEYANKRYEHLNKRTGKFRRFSKISKSFFDELSILFDGKLLYGEDEVWVRDIKNRGYFVDLIEEGSKKLIEFNGNFYHANPSLYKSDSIIKISKTKILNAENIWNQDLEKINRLKELGYEVLVIWESEVYENKLLTINKCLNFLKNKK